MPPRETLPQAVARLESERAKSGALDKAALPKRLPLDEIKLCPKVFQPRVDTLADGTCNPGFVDELVKHLRNKPATERQFDPLLLWKAGNRAYVVNGHHRLAAYKAAQVGGSVPVEFFAGNLNEARQAAIEDGAKSRLNFYAADRNEAAWRLVVMDKRGEARLTVPQVASLSGMAPRSIDRMRQLYERLQEAHASTCQWTGERVMAEFESYKAARSQDRASDAVKGDGEEWLEAMAQEWAERLGSEFGKEPHKRPEVFARALEIYLGHTGARRAACAWGLVELDGDEHEAFLDWQADRVNDT